MGVAEGEAVGQQCETENQGVAGGFGGLDQAVGDGTGLVTGTPDRQREDQASPGKGVGVATACELGPAQLDRSFRLPDGRIRTARPALYAERRLVVASAEYLRGDIGVADRVFDPSGHVTRRRHRV